MKSIQLILTILLSCCVINAQDYKKMIIDGNHKVSEIQAAAEAYFKKKGQGRGTGYKSYKRWEYNALRDQTLDGFIRSSDFYFNEFERYNGYLNSLASNRVTSSSNWEALGPDYYNQTSGWNPGVGRITSIAIDPNNENHIVIGSVAGGIWKTLDYGQNWTVLTDNQPTMYVYALTMDPTNSDIYYWGSTNGLIFKSEDAGTTWNVLADIGQGYVNKILINPNTPSKMFCSAQNGGIFKSSDSGLNWTLIHPNATQGFDIEFKPGDYNTIYASGDRVFKSVDGGETFEEYQTSDQLIPNWDQLNIDGNTSWNLVNSNQNASVTAYGNTMAIFYQGDFSRPVTKLVSQPLDLSNASSPNLNFFYSSANWEGDVDELRVYYKSSATESWILLAEFLDSAEFWQEINLQLPNPTQDYYIAFESKSNYGRGLTLDNVLVSDPSIGTVLYEEFEYEVNSFNPTGAKMIGVSPDDPEVVYVLEEYGRIFNGLYKSTDEGSSYTKLDHQGKNYFGYSSLADDDRGQAPRDMDITVNPLDVNDVHIAGLISWRSTDGGFNFNVTSQWQPIMSINENIGYCHSDIDMMFFQNNKLYVASDGGIHVAPDPTNVNVNYFTDLSTGLGIHQFYKIGISQTNPVVVSGGSQDNGTSVFRADEIWYNWLGADGMETFIDYSNTQIMYGTSQYGSLYKTYDGGSSRNWISRPAPDRGSWVTPFEQDPFDPNTIYAAYKQIYKSNDGGDNWSIISQEFDYNANHLKIAPSDNLTLYTSHSENLYKTTTGGFGDWEQLSGFQGNINFIAIHPTNPNKLAIATTSNEKVYISDDGGDSWAAVRFDLPDFSALALVWDTTFNEDILYLGMNYGVYYLRADATAWQPYATALPKVRVNELEINTAENKIYAATYGRGLWRADLFDPSALSTTNFSLNSLKIYPNPSNGKFTISWNQHQKVSVKIYDSYGKLLYINRALDMTSPVSPDLKLSQGLYIIKINSSNQEISKKLIIE